MTGHMRKVGAKSEGEMVEVNWGADGSGGGSRCAVGLKSVGIGGINRGMRQNPRESLVRQCQGHHESYLTRYASCCTVGGLHSSAARPVAELPYNGLYKLTWDTLFHLGSAFRCISC